ncbi:MAG: DUF4169 family protein [Alphaproteobacteria bacterium]|nr:DUF4169 family protein [Pseudomonadota bacterium]TDI66421.1 MAG: DUF4169 family protein [Alphaproteobacteria bacterium]
MGDVVNLNQYRKKRQRDEKSRAARENRARFGRTGAEASGQRHEAEKAGDELGRKRLVPVTQDDPQPRPGANREPPEDGTPSAG